MHALCTECGAYLCRITGDLVSSVCSECGTTLNYKEVVKKGSTFLMYPIDRQLKVLLEKNGIGNKIIEGSNGDSISDICDGSEYKKLGINFPNALPLLATPMASLHSTLQIHLCGRYILLLMNCPFVSDMCTCC